MVNASFWILIASFYCYKLKLMDEYLNCQVLDFVMNLTTTVCCSNVC